MEKDITGDIFSANGDIDHSLLNKMMQEGIENDKTKFIKVWSLLILILEPLDIGLWIPFYGHWTDLAALVNYAIVVMFGFNCYYLIQYLLMGKLSRNLFAVQNVWIFTVSLKFNFCGMAGIMLTDLPDTHSGAEVLRTACNNATFLLLFLL